jgi:hypothetical protein
MRHFNLSIKLTNVVESIKIGRETSVQTENLVFNHCRQRKQVEKVCVVFPYIRITILSQTFIVKTINLRNLPRLMVSPQNSDPVFKSDFQSDQQSNCLDRVVTSVYIISHKQIVCIWTLSTDFEQLHQIMELTVNISAHCDWALHWLHIRLFG